MRLSDIKKIVVKDPSKRIWAIREVYLVNGKHLRLAKEKVDLWTGYALKPGRAEETTARESLLRELGGALEYILDKHGSLCGCDPGICEYHILIRRAREAVK